MRKPWAALFSALYCADGLDGAGTGNYLRIIQCICTQIWNIHQPPREFENEIYSVNTGYHFWKELKTLTF